MGMGNSTAPTDDRITRVGTILRTLSLDEIPQLINVIKGEMSLVGPRPFVRDHVDLCTDYQRRRLEMKPGMTGLAVVKGRNSLTWDAKFDLDVLYVDRWSLWLDIKLLVKTMWVAIVRTGVYGHPEVDYGATVYQATANIDESPQNTTTSGPAIR